MKQDIAKRRTRTTTAARFDAVMQVAEEQQNFDADQTGLASYNAYSLLWPIDGMGSLPRTTRRLPGAGQDRECRFAVGILLL